MNTLHLLRRARAWLGVSAVALLGLCAGPTWAQEDPPGRVGRLAEVQGGVSWYDDEQGVWSEAERNRPLTSGDRLSTGAQGRAELRIGSTVLRLSAGTELEVLRLDDERMGFQLHSGSLALRVRSREVADEIEVLTGEARFRPARAGHYRFDRSDDSTFAGAWRGSLRIDDPAGFVIETGQRAELWREGRQGRQLRFAWSTLPSDAFGDWVARDEQRDERSASARYVSPEMTGAEDLDRHGRWDRHDEYGAIWFPLQVRAEWAPYRYGRWTWVRPWGWTWVDEAPWGFAPFHYGRWVNWRGRWGWVPGDYVARPVYAPALVAWVGGGGFSASINIGGPTIGWVPLAPREWYVPHHRHSPVYVERVNPHPPGRRHERPVHTGPIMYNNQGVPGAVTVVPRDVLLNRQPVSRGAIDASEWQRSRGREPLPRAAPPDREAPFRGPRPQPAPGFVQPVPGGAQPVPLPPGARNGREEREDRDRRDGRDRNDGRDRRDGRDGRRPDAAPAPAPAPTMQPQPQPQVQPPPAVIDLRRERPPAAVPPPSSVQPQPPTQAQPPQRPPRDRDNAPRDRDRDRDGPRLQPGPQPAPQPAPNAVQPAPARPAAPPPAAAPAAPAPAAAPVKPAAPAPAAAPAPRQPPTSAPERAREREAERERARDDDRKRAPEGRQQRDRERESLR